MKLLPHPMVYLYRVSDESDFACQYAYVMAQETFAHVLAEGKDLVVYRAGHPEDWILEIMMSSFINATQMFGGDLIVAN
jgi:hypothetical protein